MSFLRAPLPTLFHSASGLFILGFDWLLFSGGLLTLGVSTPLLLVFGGLFTTATVAGIQSQYGDDDRSRALLKGIAGGLLVGLPLPVAGTGVGGLVLTLSGLNHLLAPSSPPSENTESTLPDHTDQ